MTTYPVNTGIIPIAIQLRFNMTIIKTLTKAMDDGRVSTWRFLEIDGKYCSLAGHYKHMKYSSIANMNDSISWFKSVGYSELATPVAA